MLFNSLQFFVFLLILLIIFFKCDTKNQKRVLFIFSLYFYSCLKIVFVPLLLFSFLVTHLTSLGIHNSTKVNYKKVYLFINLLVNLGLLFIFKYADFIQSVEYDLLKVLGFNFNPPQNFNLILPLGISLYTFQAIA